MSISFFRSGAGFGVVTTAVLLSLAQAFADASTSPVATPLQRVLPIRGELTAPTAGKASSDGRVSFDGGLTWIGITSAVVAKDASPDPGGGKGKPILHDITITKYLDAASPTLQRSSETGRHFENVVVQFHGQTYSLENAVIRRMQIVPRTSVAMESIDLGYESLK